MLISLASCDLFKKKADEHNQPGSNEKVLAQANQNQLLLSDFDELIDESLSKEDSAAFVKNYVNKWVKKQLLLEHSESSVDAGKDEITQKLREYRNSLIIFEYQQNYLKEKLDTIITEDEIRNYYEKNLKLFELKENIFKGIVIKLPKDAPNLEKVGGWIQSGKQKDLKELRSYCHRFASYFALEDSIWLNFDYIIQNTPFAKNQDKRKILETSGFHSTTDEHFAYFLKIRDYKINNQISPLNYVRDQINIILLNKRKTKLLNDLETTIYKEGKEEQKFKIYQ